MNHKSLKAPSKIQRSPNSQIAPSGLRSNSLNVSTQSLNQTEAQKNPENLAVGSRVFVNGTRPGILRYLGQTQFAPGDWAGVSLDEPLGKNDGSVDGVQYFQCDPKYGLFTKLSKLSRYPINDSTPTKTPTRSITTMSPASSVKSMSASTTRLKLGDRVSVNATNGQKSGMLRYIGNTEFATGEWAGIELDEPIGKNDGSVAGKRYFNCPPLHGLFAPVYKVSKAYNRSLMNSPAHRGNSGSCESLTDSISSASSATRSKIKLGINSLNKKPRPPIPNVASTNTALQEALKEKEIHIEQLLQERDLERAEVAKYASQIEETEHKMRKFQQENHQILEENTQHLNHFQQLLVAKDQENRELSSQLEEEKRKIEDLQFQLEEESITKVELENMLKQREENRNESLDDKEDKLLELQEDLFKKDEALLHLETILEDQKKNLMRLSEANSELMNQLDQETDGKQSYKKENEDLRKKVDRVTHQLESGSNKSESLLKEIENLKKSHSDLKNKTNNLEMVLQASENKSSELESQLDDKKADCLLLESHVRKLEKDFQDLSLGKSSDIQLSQRKLEEMHKNESLWKLRADELEDEKNKLLTHCQSLENELTMVHQSMKEQEQELRDSVEQTKQLVAGLQFERKELQVIIENSNSEKQSLIEEKNKLAGEIEEKMAQQRETLMNEKRLAVNKSEEQLSLLKSQLVQFQSQFTNYKSELQNKLSQSQQECNALQQLRQQMEDQQNNLQKSSLQLDQALADKDRLQNTINNLTKDIEELKNQVLNLQLQLESSHARERELSIYCENQKLSLNEREEKISNFEDQVIMNKRKFSEDKKHLESKIVELQVVLAQTQNSSNNARAKEDIESLQNQIEFLNTVIVDMHRKNDYLQSRMESTDKNELDPSQNLNGIKPVVSPRLFCDICDCFDLHDTEDCPCQSTNEDLSAAHSQHHRPRQEIRPYCDNCEQFGHWTKGCDETF